MNVDLDYEVKDGSLFVKALFIIRDNYEKSW